MHYSPKHLKDVVPLDIVNLGDTLQIPKLKEDFYSDLSMLIIYLNLRTLN